MEPAEAHLPRLVVLVGPTAAGKSALALRLAEAAGAEIVSADSQQVYRGMDVGTGKVSPAERARVPHHLIDVVDPDEEMTAARYAALADEAIAGAAAAGRSSSRAGRGSTSARSCAGSSPGRRPTRGCARSSRPRTPPRCTSGCAP